ncbi:hypothetical protein Mal64_37880 [Pseudobythopirellula maris]|uniref:Gamma-butyrobetaine hydroxylase-like N-terminal domain-containing protein n=1 Tax=Pseudobythopirellula maris TaxID=2527991 RepID=A0A5C5ZGH3_9BACT|nr:DUF971 domain-containing protein [Pseudobythopirellula maris]TWT86248.1 hypothetical protein Mal64_37880 [Pseudobythopirellula maris]
MLLPTTIERLAENRLRIEWSDGQSRDYTAAELRAECPCASCKEKHGPKPAPDPMQLTVLSADEARPLTIVGMRPVGSYAYHVDFSDGHSTGLYTFEKLHELGEAVG